MSEKEKRTFTITLEEILTQDFTVVADSEEEARSIFKDMYEDELVNITEPKSLRMSIMVNNDGLEEIDRWDQRSDLSRPDSRLDPRSYDNDIIDGLFHSDDKVVRKILSEDENQDFNVIDAVLSVFSVNDEINEEKEDADDNE